MQEYAKRLAEVDEIIKYLPEQYRKRIPKELMEMIKQNKDNNYNWIFNNKKKLYHQDIPRDTIAILSYINMEYFLNDEQKEFMKKCHFLNEKSIHTSENIFKNVKKVDKKEITLVESNKKSGLFEKIKKMFKGILKIR
jgi:hypothetical protein